MLASETAVAAARTALQAPGAGDTDDAELVARLEIELDRLTDEPAGEFNSEFELGLELLRLRGVDAHRRLAARRDELEEALLLDVDAGQRAAGRYRARWCRRHGAVRRDR